LEVFAGDFTAALTGALAADFFTGTELFFAVEAVLATGLAIAFLVAFAGAAFLTTALLAVALLAVVFLAGAAFFGATYASFRTSLRCITKIRATTRALVKQKAQHGPHRKDVF
jgi:hypothetical protein